MTAKLEGERYKKSPELVKEQLQRHPAYTAPAEYLICKRWDRLEEQDEPLIVAFFATADVLSGLFTLANFDESSSQGVIAPFGAGCASIVYHPYFESKSEHPRGVLGMFDVSARPYVEPGVLTLAVPWEKFVRMVRNMDESFLITNSWDKVRKRIGQRSSVLTSVHSTGNGEHGPANQSSMVSPGFMTMHSTGLPRSRSTELLRILLDDVKRVVMHRHDFFRLQEINGSGGIDGTHRKIVANR